MEAQISKESAVNVKREKGKFGELRIAIDDVDVVDVNPLWYPLPGSVIAKVKAYLAEAP